MKRYDPMRSPKPSEWLALDESERVDLAMEFHTRHHLKPGSLRAHAMFHAIVETQVAMGEELPVAATLERLQAEGLDRHEAVHAIASVLAEIVHGAATGSLSGDQRTAYISGLEKLHANEWRHAR